MGQPSRSLPDKDRKVRLLMKQTVNFQDSFLTQARKNRIQLVVFLMNGFQMRGVITGFDNFVILLQTDNKQQMIYKHAVSTIVPEHPVSFRDTEE